MSTASPTSRWMTGNVDLFDQTTPCYGYGAIFYGSQTDFKLHAIDFQDGTKKWTANLPPGSYESPMIYQGTLYITDDFGKMYAVDPQTGEKLWGPLAVNDGASPLSKPYPASLFTSIAPQTPALYLTDTASIYQVVLDPGGGTPIVSKVFTTTDATIKIYGPQLDTTTHHLILPTTKGVMAVKVPTTKDSSWSEAWHLDLGGLPTVPLVDQGKVYIGRADGYLSMIDIKTQHETKSDKKLGDDIVHRAFIYKDTVFSATDDGTIHLLDAKTLQVTDGFKPGGEPTTPFYRNRELLYYGSKDQHIYAIDLSNPVGAVASFEAGGPVTYLVETANGKAYFGTSDILYSVDFETLIHEFHAQSAYMVDFVPDTEAASKTKQVPSYQTHLTLYDKKKNVLPGESVKIWAKSDCEVTVGTKTYRLGPKTPVAMETDGSGRVVFGVLADPTITHDVATGLATPPIQVWAGFMEQDERILIYPDQRLHQGLSKVTGEQLQEYHQYNQGDPKADPTPKDKLLPTGFQGKKGLKHAQTVAKVVNNTVSLEKPPALLAGTPQTKYLAFPESMFGVSYHPTPPDTTRPAGVGPVESWTLDWTDADNPQFKPATSAQEVDAFVTYSHWELYGRPESIWGDIKHFVKNVVNGAERLLKAAWKFAENTITAIIHTAENAYKFVVKTVEDAVTVVAGILKTIAKDIEKILEALSWLFKWKDILEMHNTIKGMVKGCPSKITSAISTIRNGADKYFKDWESTVQSDFSKLIDKLGSRTIDGTGGPHQDPSSMYGSGQHNVHVQGNWLLHKMMHHAAHGHSAIATTGGVTLDEHFAAGGESLVQAIEDFFSSVGQQAGEVSADLADEMVDLVKSFIELLSSPSGFRKQTLASLLQGLEKLTVDLLKLADAVVDGFLDLVNGIIDTLVDLLEAEIDIPLVSDIYKLLTGDSLTVLDLTCLVLAIPVTVLSKALSSEEPLEDPRLEELRLAVTSGSGLKIENLIFAVNGFVIAVVDSVILLAGSFGGILNTAMACLLAIRQVTTMPTSWNAKTPAIGLLWLYHWLTPMFQMYITKEGQSAKETMATATSLFGIGNATWLGMYAIVLPDKYFDGGYRLAQNELFALSQITKIGAASDDEDVKMVVAAVDFFLDAGNGLMELKYLDGGPGASLRSPMAASPLASGQAHAIHDASGSQKFSSWQEAASLLR